ncbi:MAG: hypothetical protein K6B70_04190 [Clostridia bacterium]|nr:hypothetical protein [Clostridia bacterium]
MIVLHKNRLILIGCLVCISLTVLSFKSAFTNPKTVPTVNLPVSNKVIVLDAGHGVPDERCRKQQRNNRSRN